MTATKNESAFRLEYAVAVSIRARPEDIWARLTNAAELPRWNSTVTSVEGEIAQGQRLTIRVPIAPGRAFKPRVVSLEPGKRMVWSDGMAPMFKGKRTFELTPGADGMTEFAMSETFAGLMLPMIKRSLPDFRPVFEQYASDLKRACEA